MTANFLRKHNDFKSLPSPTRSNTSRTGHQQEMTPERTLVIYSGPTSLDRSNAKNGMYIDNMNYFIEYGISCNDYDAKPLNPNDGADPVSVSYVFVVTQDVKDFYTSANGPVTKKKKKCQLDGMEFENQISHPFITVIVRQDRCYDMESMRIVLEEIDVEKEYDNLLFLNCGLVGPKIGAGSPKMVPSRSKSHQNRKPNKRLDELVPYSHWTQLYTSHLTDSIRMVGHSINTHFHTYLPHVQSFLYAIRTETIPILLESGSIYDCGLTQEELGTNGEKRFELINRYEVGMSQSLIKKGYKIGTSFINRWDMGKPLVMDQYSISGTEFDDTVSDIWYEDIIRNLTSTISNPHPTWWTNENETFEEHKWDILPWDYYVFFKVSRLVPQDIQDAMGYNTLGMTDIPVIPNDPRKSPSHAWRVKMGVDHPELSQFGIVTFTKCIAKCALLGAVAFFFFLHRRLMVFGLAKAIKRRSL
ncbi:hypothetical protein ACHAXS_003042 [Conticribra weissflogii]